MIPHIDPVKENELPAPAPIIPPTPVAREETLTIRIPKVNWLMGALILVAVIAGFQTVQLVRLKDSVSAKVATTTPAASSSTAATSQSTGSSADLQSQVGGC